jgi:hypothetical protein
VELGQCVRTKLLSAVVADETAGLLARVDWGGCYLGAGGILFLGDFGLDLVEGPVLVVP